MNLRLEIYERDKSLHDNIVKKCREKCIQHTEDGEIVIIQAEGSNQTLNNIIDYIAYTGMSYFFILYERGYSYVKEEKKGSQKT